MRRAGPHLFVHCDDATFVDADAGFLRIELIAVGPSPDGDKHTVINTDLRRVLAFKTDFDTRHRSAHARDLRRRHDGLVPRLDDLEERPQQVLVRAGHQLIHEFDDADFGAERAVNAGHLEPDDAAADDEHALRQRIELERARRIDDARIIRQPRQFHRLGTGRNDAFFERNGLARVQRELVRRRKFHCSVKHAYLALLCELRQAACQFSDDFVFPAAKFESVDLRLTKGNAVIRHRRSFVDDLRGMQQCLGRNTADVEANAAERSPAFDQDDVHTEIRRTKRRRVAAGSGADNNELCAVIGH